MTNLELVQKIMRANEALAYAEAVKTIAFIKAKRGQLV
jgi:hypothetical protein